MAAGLRQVGPVNNNICLDMLPACSSWQLCTGGSYCRHCCSCQLGSQAMPGRRSTLRNRWLEDHCQIWVLGVPDIDKTKSKCLQALTVGGTSAAFSSIIAAISAASPGSMIQIAEGRLVACDTKHTQTHCVAWPRGLASSSTSPCLCEMAHV